MTIAELNRLPQPAFAAELGQVFEHSPWVAQRAFPSHPFPSVDRLHDSMMAAVRSASLEERLTLIRAHPELAGAEAVAGELTPDSRSEQGRLGLTSLPRHEFNRLGELNRRYREKFGFPCVIALRLHASRETVLKDMEQRLQNDREGELENALTQIGYVTRGRLAKIFGEG